MSEAIETGEVANTSVDVELDNAIDNISLDDLLALSKEDVEEFDEEVNHVGMKPLSQWMKNIPSDVRKHLANIRRDYTIKTQEISKIRSELETAKREAVTRNETLLNGDLSKKLAAIDEEATFDLFDPDGMKAEIQRQAAIMLKQMLAPAKEELEVQQRKLALESFKKENPEMTDPEYRKEIVSLLKDRPELKLEDAFYITKAKLGATKASQAAAAKELDKKARREVVQKSSSGSRSQPSGVPKFNSALEAYRYHKSQQTKK